MLTAEEFKSWIKRMLCSFDDKEPALRVMIEDFKDSDSNSGPNHFIGTYFEVITADKKAMIINRSTLQSASIKINRNRKIDYSEIFAALWAKYNGKPIPTKMLTLSELKPGTKFKIHHNEYIYIGKNDYLNAYVTYRLDTREYCNFYNPSVIPIE